MEVKIAFVLDVTASMGPWIHEAKTKIVDMMNALQEDHGVRIKVALVAYRDYGDTEHFKIVDFTTAEDIQGVLEGIEAEGGEDEAEDVAGALLQARDLSWNGSDVCMVVHIADAPAHGLRYHRSHVSDRYTMGDPTGIYLEEILAELSTDDIEYTFVKITSSTDKMIDVFQRAYGSPMKFRILDLRPQQYDEDTTVLLTPALTRAITMSITQNTSSQET